jgi:hypothetical protein
MFKIIICTLIIAFSIWVISCVYHKLKETSEVNNSDSAAAMGYEYVSDKDIFRALSE